MSERRPRGGKVATADVTTIASDLLDRIDAQAANIPDGVEYGELFRAASEAYIPSRVAFSEVMQALNESKDDSDSDVSDVGVVPECEWLQTEIAKEHPLQHIVNSAAPERETSAKFSAQHPTQTISPPENVNAYLVAHSIEEAIFHNAPRDRHPRLLKEVFAGVEARNGRLRHRLLRHSLSGNDIAAMLPGDITRMFTRDRVAGPGF